MRVRARGAVRTVVAVPVNALRKGPDGDHVFVIAPDNEGKPRAQMRRVESGAMLRDEILILAGLSAGEQVAASGSFKLREMALVAITSDREAGTDRLGRTSSNKHRHKNLPCARLPIPSSSTRCLP